METLTKIEPNKTFSFIVPEMYKEGLRIDRFITQQFPLYSRHFFQQLIDDELITLNGKVVTKQSVIVKPLDKVTVTFPPERKIDEAVISKVIAEKNLDVEVIAKEDHFLIVYKPANLLVHTPSARSNAVTLSDWLLANYKELATIGYSDRPAIIHRLDKDTSGLLIIPRTPYAHAVFGDMFRNRAVTKIYHALVKGHPPVSGTIDLAIGRDPRNKTKMAAYVVSGKSEGIQPVRNNNNISVLDINASNMNGTAKVRDALTHYRVLEYFDDCALVEVKLVTGRMHQIRVHFAAIGHPVIGDPVYGVKSKFIKRQALHAHTISFDFEGKTYTYSKDVPEDFTRVINNLRKLS